MYKATMAILILAALASGCTIKAPGLVVSTPGVEIGIDGGSGHCPPGQAKKGNC